MREHHQDQPNTEDHNDPKYEAFPDNSRETGMNILANARNCMIDNFRSTKLFYHELEEIRERIGQMERIKDELGLGYQIDQEERFNLMERRILDLENYNQTLENHMISILNLMNDNIQTLHKSA